LTGVKVLVVDDQPRNLFAITALLERGRADVTVVESGVAALAALERAPDIDIVLMDIMMPEMDGYETIRAIRASGQHRSVSVIAVTAKVMAGERKRCLDAGADDYVPKSVDQAELLSAMRRWLPARSQPMAPESAPESWPYPGPESRPAVLATTEVPQTDHHLPEAIEGSVLTGLKILVVDDDYRNIFAMTAVLERGDAVVAVAESGAEAIDTLERTPDIDIVLMDIMMPVMDGYDTIRAIRRISRFEMLPIVAVTGKAADGERRRCLEAGANDYIPKPVDSASLLTSLIPWLLTPQPQVL